MHLRLKRAFIIAVTIVCALTANNVRATPIVFSTSVISRSSGVLEDAGTTSSAVDDGVNSAASFLLPTSGAMGAIVHSDGSAFSVRTTAAVADDWFCSLGCGSVVSTPVDVVAGITFDAIIQGALATGGDEFSLTARYIVPGGAGLFVVGAFRDSSPITAGASLGGVDIPVVMTTDASGDVHLSAHVEVPFIICPCTALPDTPLFSDEQSMSLEMEGSGTLDAAHTFSVTLTPLDPNVFLIGSSGRTAGVDATSPVPEPASVTLMTTGLLAMMWRRRQREESGKNGTVTRGSSIDR
ncbi:MAG: PEP-CTERM sorting domain-containing protein [Vicinamibacterales bacterium]